MRRFTLAIMLLISGLLAPAAADELPSPGALVHVKVIDVDVTAASKVKFEIQKSGETSAPDWALLERLQTVIAETADVNEKRSHSFVLTSDDPGHGVLNGLRRAKIAKVIAEPNVASAFGRPGRFNSGGEFPVPKDAAANSVEMKPYGTRIESLVTETDAGRAVVDITVHLSEIDETRTVKSGKFNVPRLRVFDTNTGFEANWGETFVLCSKRPDQKKGFGEPHKIVRLVLVTPERIASPTPAVAAKPGPANK